MRVAIVNDMPMAVEGLRRVVLSTGEHEIAWVAIDGTDAIQKCASDVPDLILMDLIMPRMNGVEATRRIMVTCPCPIMIVTASVNENSSMVFEAMGNGALDAINTPLLYGQNVELEYTSLLRKITMLQVLTQPVKLFKPECNRKSGGEIGSRSKEHLVAIGASSGGPQALSELLNKIPANFKAAVVIVQHVDVHFSQGLADWLSLKSCLPVKIIVEGDRPVAGTIFLSGSNDHLVLTRNGTFEYVKEPVEIPYRPSVDVFWQSLQQYWLGELTVVLLTGMGKDGAESMLKLRNRGAHTIVQNKETCAVYGMPKAAVELKAAVDVEPIDNIARILISRHGLR